MYSVQVRYYYFELNWTIVDCRAPFQANWNIHFSIINGQSFLRSLQYKSLFMCCSTSISYALGFSKTSIISVLRTYSCWTGAFLASNRFFLLVQFYVVKHIQMTLKQICEKILWVKCLLNALASLLLLGGCVFLSKLSTAERNAH